MGDLTKRRAARDLWISRSHVKAALVGAFLLSGASFGLGYVVGLGGSSTGAPAASWMASQGYADKVPGEDLVVLLARVEANRAPHGGVESLTFPDELARAADDVPVGPVAPEGSLVLVPVPEPLEPLGQPVHIGGDGAAAPDLPPPPIGAYTLRVATVADREAAERLAASLGGCVAGGEGCAAALEGLNPWVGATIVGGELQYIVSLGGFASETAAEQALEGVVVLPGTRDASVATIP